VRRHYAKTCDLPDFKDPEIARLIAEIAPRFTRREPERKAWEYATCALFLEETGHLNERSRVLDVGAGADPMLYWLANRTSETVAIDLYDDGGFADPETELTMVSAPESHAPYPYAQDRLSVRPMDARALEFADETFDAVVSFSSIEHFGGPAGIAAAAREIGRVLRPGGHAFITTELFIDYRLMARPWVQFGIRLGTLGRRCASATPRRRVWPEVLVEREIHEWIVVPSGLELMQPLRKAVSAETRAHICPLAPDGTRPRGLAGDEPFVLLSHLGSTFTSVALPLVKPG
jgi:ubiquinone/menaquinone biosynthesis C-methylase UbiE